MNVKPIALTIGEPAGVGPELTELAWAELRRELCFFVIGDPAHLPGTCPILEISDPTQALSASPDALPVLPVQFAAKNQPGTPNPLNAPMVVDAIASAVQLTIKGQASAVCTNPIHKKALIDGADFPYPGHTEYLAALAGVEQVVMMLAAPDLKVVPATIHIPLSAVPTTLTAELLAHAIKITHRAMQTDFGVANPRIAIAGLNPHAGEGGAMGHEEISLIQPVVEDLREQGLDLLGPLSADTMFHARARETYDAAIALYHDQALIPIKTLAFDEGVNVTLGLPFIRTSPDHGTALDIAGQGIARPDSLIAVLRMADNMAKARSI